MKILISNKAKLSRKYVRFIKWRLYGVNRKFKHLLYAEVFLTIEGSSPSRYIATVRLGIPGNDIILRHRSHSVERLFKKTSTDIHRYLNKSKPSAQQHRSKRKKVLLSIP